MSTSHPPDVIHVTNAPSLFFVAPLRPCIIILLSTQTEEEKNGVGLGTGLGRQGPFLCRLLLVLQQNATHCCVMCVQFPQFMHDILCSFRPPLKQPTCAVNFVDNRTSFIICYLATNWQICSLLWEDVKLKLVMTFPQAPHQFPEITVFFAWASKEGKCQI